MLVGDDDLDDSIGVEITDPDPVMVPAVAPSAPSKRRKSNDTSGASIDDVVCLDDDDSDSDGESAVCPSPTLPSPPATAATVRMRMFCRINFGVLLLRARVCCSHLWGDADVSIAFCCCGNSHHAHPHQHSPTYPPNHIPPLSLTHTHVAHSCVCHSHHARVGTSFIPCVKRHDPTWGADSLAPLLPVVVSMKPIRHSPRQSDLATARKAIPTRAL